MNLIKTVLWGLVGWWGRVGVGVGVIEFSPPVLWAVIVALLVDTNRSLVNTGGISPLVSKEDVMPFWSE